MKETIEMKEMKDLKGPPAPVDLERNEKHNRNERKNIIEMKEMKELRAPWTMKEMINTIEMKGFRGPAGSKKWN